MLHLQLYIFVISSQFSLFIANIMNNENSNNDNNNNSVLSFLPTDAVLRRMPFLEQLMTEVESFVANKIQQYGVQKDDQAEVRRYIAGNVARQDLNQMRGAFRALSKAETNLWNACVALETETLAEQQLKLSFKDHMAGVKRKYDSLGEDKDLLAVVEAKRLEMNENLQDKSTGIRVKRYENDVKALKNNVSTMRDNYGTHIILLGLSRNIDDSSFFPSFVSFQGILHVLLITMGN